MILTRKMSLPRRNEPALARNARKRPNASFPPSPDKRGRFATTPLPKLPGTVYGSERWTIPGAKEEIP